MTIVGGELKSYTDMMNEARDLATKRMIEEAMGMGADAVINVRFSSASIHGRRSRSNGLWNSS